MDNPVNTEPAIEDRQAAILAADTIAPQNAVPDAQMPIQVQQAPQQAVMAQQAPQEAVMAQQVPQATVASRPVQPSAPAQAPGIQQIIDQQNAQIQALMDQNQALNAQVIAMVQGGAQFGSGQSQTQAPIQSEPQYPTQVQQMAQLGAQPDPLGTFNPPSLAAGQDVSLEALASEIGKDR